MCEAKRKKNITHKHTYFVEETQKHKSHQLQPGQLARVRNLHHHTTNRIPFDRLADDFKMAQKKYKAVGSLNR